MNRYERLLDEITSDHISVDEQTLKNDPVKGIYLNEEGSRPVIAVDGALPASEKRCILAEEAGHHYKSCGNILDQSGVQARKSEQAGRRWAWQYLLPIEYLALEKWNHPEMNLEELAAHLEVTETFLQDAVTHYHRRYGTLTELPCGLTVQFDPYFDVWQTGEPHEEYAWYPRGGRRLDARQRERLAMIARKLSRLG